MTASVVITSYNQCEMLADAVDSALAQTRQPHEIIVADDGSHDDSPAMIASLERRHPGLVRGVCQAENVGISRNRNAGLAAVTGDRVAILDGDDLLEPRFLEVLVAALDAAPGAGAAYANHVVVDAHGSLLRRKFAQPQPTGDLTAHIAVGTFGIMRSMLMQTDLLREIGGMDPRYPKHDGFVFTLRLARLTRFVYVDECLVTKRDHPGGDSKTFDRSARRRYLEDVFVAVTREIADLSAEERNRVIERWDRRLAALDR